jgi:hypothetical protein
MSEVGFKGALKTVLTDLLRVDMGRPYLPALPLTHAQQCTLRENLAKTDFDMLTAL